MKCEPISPDFVPVAQREAIGGKQLANPMRIPSKDVLQNWDQNAERILTQYRPLGDSSDRFGFRHRNSVSIVTIDVMHYVKVRASVANVNGPIGAALQFQFQVLKDGNFAVTR